MISPLKKLAKDLDRRGFEGPARLAREADAVRCVWSQQDYDGAHWAANCGADWEFFDGGPVDNKVQFCPVCGNQITAVPYELDDEED